LFQTVDCSAHGEQQAAFVCRHLVQTIADGRPRGFFWSVTEAGELHAWCAACERLSEEHGGWTDEDEREMAVTLVCRECCERAREANT
jgi:hypothetical protein